MTDWGAPIAALLTAAASGLGHFVVGRRSRGKLDSIGAQLDTGNGHTIADEIAALRADVQSALRKAGTAVSEAREAHRNSVEAVRLISEQDRRAAGR